MLHILNFFKTTSSSYILAFCFIFIGCDYANQQKQKDISLKGEKITIPNSNKFANLTKNCSDCDKSFEVYSINMNSPNIDKIENKVNATLKNARHESPKNNTSAEPIPQQITLEDSYYLESQDPEKEDLLVTPLSQGSEYSHQYTFAKTNETQLTSSVAYYHAETSIKKSSLEGNDDLWDNATINLTLRNQNGTAVYQNTFSKNSQSVTNFNSKKNTTKTCVGDCIDDTYDNMNWYQFGYCLVYSYICFAGILLGCSAGCLAIAIFL